MQQTPDLFANVPQPTSAAAVVAAEALASRGGAEVRGAVFTRGEVVDFILDLVGYTTDQPLHHKRLLEPSFGGGDFLHRVVDRLLTAWRSEGADASAVGALGNAILAVELHRETFDRTRQALLAQLLERGIDVESAQRLVATWLIQGDFLLTPVARDFTHVVGNPPYVRQELIPDALMREYRARYSTIYDRADLYVPFIEHSLHALAKRGSLGFICADRWMKNRYGGRLRRLVAEEFHLKVYVDMVGTSAFHSDVVAYPAITIISREAAGPTRVAHRPATDSASLAALAASLSTPSTSDGPVRALARVANGEAPWLLECADQIGLLRRLEEDFPLLEETGCKVGIGVATGADKAFIGEYASLEVEPDRKLPLVTTRDILAGDVQWHGQGVINPFADDGRLVELSDYPRLRRFLEYRKEIIAGRHCAMKNPGAWYRTIDRIFPALCAKPKLLIPDIKGESHVVFEGGRYYPHHNLYYITSDTWDLRALQAVLLSGIGSLFVASYSTKMRGGFLRFQAQYLRRIRLPHWQVVPEDLRDALRDAAVRRDVNACNLAAFALYGLSREERAALGGNGVNAIGSGAVRTQGKGGSPCLLEKPT